MKQIIDGHEIDVPEHLMPAFPVNELHGLTGNIEANHMCMTLRDYFAAKAMQAIMQSDRYSGVIGVNNYAQNCSKMAYEMADAMLKARQS